MRIGDHMQIYFILPSDNRAALKSHDFINIFNDLYTMPDT